MYILVGLGNPGKKYQNNRHNVGHMFIDYLIKELRITDYGLKMSNTNCFMNESGKFIKNLIRNSQFVIDNLIIVHDDLDIPLGKFKIQKGQGPRLHNGINSIEQALGTADFWRIRIGVDNRKPEEWVDGETYVLQNLTDKEKETLEEVYPRIYKRLSTNLLK